MRELLFQKALTETYENGYENNKNVMREYDDDVSRGLSIRLLELEMFAVKAAPKRRASRFGCEGNKYIRITEGIFGQTSNQILTIAHGLALADSLRGEGGRGSGGSFDDIHYTLLVPHVIASSLAPFNITLLQSLYCIEILAASKGPASEKDAFILKQRAEEESMKEWILKLIGWKSKEELNKLVDKANEKKLSRENHQRVISDPLFRQGDLSITSKDLFLWGIKEREGKHKGRSRYELLNGMGLDLSLEGNYSRRLELYSHYVVGVLAALWSHPTKSLRQGLEVIVRSQLQGSFNYSSVHKRGLDKMCEKLFRLRSNYSRDFPDLLAWDGKGKHPLCEMPPSRILDLCAREGASQVIFLASDHQTDDSDWLRRSKKDLSVVGYDVFRRLNLEKYLSGVHYKFLDLLLMMMADGLFVGNPASTMSLQVTVFCCCSDY